MPTDEKLFRSIFAAQGKSFRGSVLTFVKDAPMGKGHGNDGKPFDIETACYLKPIFAEYDRAKANNTRLLMCVLAAVKTLKSFCGEVMAADHVCNCAGDFAILFATEKVSDVGSTTRIVEYLRGIPLFAKKMETISNRFGDSKGALKFPDKTLFIIAANLTNLQQKNLGGLIFQDAFLSEASGMIAEMIARTTQYQKEAFIYLESQGGEKGYDFDEKYLETNQGELHTLCPHCRRNHIFNWKAFDAEAMRRPDSFMPTPPVIIPSLDHADWIAHHRPLMLAENQRIAGFQRGDEALIKRKDGSQIDSAILTQTHFRCFYCDGIWRDDGEFGPTRIALDRSSNYVSANPNALPENVGFNFPQWINRRIPWGSLMLEKLNSQRINKERANVELLKKWWQKVAARTWNEDILKDNRIRYQDAYDVALAKHDAWRLFMIVDNQLDLMTQWVVVWACKKNGVLRQLWRGSLHGLAEVRAKQMEYLSAEGKPLIKDQFVFLDGRHKGELICRHIVENKYGHWATMDGERVWLAWNLMMGSSYEFFSHADEKDKSRKFVCGDPTIRNFQLDGNHVEIWSFPFSATMCGQRFEGLRDMDVKAGEERPLDFLPQQDGEPADDHELSHHSQIYSNKLVASKSYAPRMAKMHYVPVPASRPDHYFHIGRMAMAVLEIWGVDGIYVNTPDPATPAAPVPAA